MRPLLLLAALCIHTAHGEELALTGAAGKLRKQSRKDAQFLPTPKS